MTSKKTIERAAKMLALMRQNPSWNAWKGRSSKLFRVWAKECGIGETRAYAAFNTCIVYLGLQGLVQRVGGNWELVEEAAREQE